MSAVERGFPWSSNGGRLGFKGSKTLKMRCHYWLVANPDLIFITCQQCKHGQFQLHTWLRPSARLSPPGCRTCRSRETWASGSFLFYPAAYFTLMSDVGSDQQGRARHTPDRRGPRSRGSSSWPGRWAKAPGCCGSASESHPRSARLPLSPCTAPQVATPERFLKSFLGFFWQHLLSPPS